MHRLKQYRGLKRNNEVFIIPLIIPALKFPLFHYSSPENIIIPLFPTTAKISVILYIHSSSPPEQYIVIFRNLQRLFMNQKSVIKENLQKLLIKTHIQCLRFFWAKSSVSDAKNREQTVWTYAGLVKYDTYSTVISFSTKNLFAVRFPVYTKRHLIVTI